MLTQFSIRVVHLRSVEYQPAVYGNYYYYFFLLALIIYWLLFSVENNNNQRVNVGNTRMQLGWTRTHSHFSPVQMALYSGSVVGCSVGMGSLFSFFFSWILRLGWVRFLDDHLHRLEKGVFSGNLSGEISSAVGYEHFAMVAFTFTQLLPGFKDLKSFLQR